MTQNNEVTTDQSTEAVEFKSLFGEEVSEAELQGEEQPEKEQGPVPDAQESKEDEAESQATQPDKQWLEEGNEIEQTTLELELQKNTTTAEEDTEFQDFKVLSGDEFEELVYDDVEEGLKYQHKLSKYKEWQEKKQSQKDLAAIITDRADKVIQESYKSMKDAVPGLNEDGNAIDEELIKFATDHGFNEEFLQFMTNPATEFVPVGSRQPFLLADGAASFVKMLYQLYQKSKDTPAKDTETDITGGKILTEDEFGKLSEKEQEAYLRGE